MKTKGQKSMERNENGFIELNTPGRNARYDREDENIGEMRNMNGGNNVMPNLPTEPENGTGERAVTPDPPVEGDNCKTDCDDGFQLAMVYSPKQCFRKLYNEQDALMNGTLFEELNKPLEY